MKIATIILAAGQGKRMNSALVKVLHPLAGLPLLSYPLDIAKRINSQRIIVVLGYQADLVKERFGNLDLSFVLQSKQLGTGDTILCTKEALRDFEGTIPILPGDVPLLKEETIRTLIEHHKETKSVLTLLTAKTTSPKNYERVMREANGRVMRVAEARDLKEKEKGLKEINSGIYCVEKDFLFETLEKIRSLNREMEYPLSTVVERAFQEGKRMSSVLTDFQEVMGVDNRIDLAYIEKLVRKEILERLMQKGVTIVNPKATYIDKGIEIGKDTTISPNCYLKGKTRIGERCFLEPGSLIVDSEIGNEVTIKSFCVITSSKIRDGAVIGPYAHLRPETDIGEVVKIGNFVEVKKSIIARGTRISHLSYIGDAIIGEGVNIGAGTITCNYDGIRKHQTIIEDGAFIGSNTELVAPVRVGKNSIIGAGSTITEDIPQDSLAISRVRQVNLKKKR